MSDITNEWRELRSKLGDLICHIDGMNESIESKMKKLQEKEEQQANLQAKIDEAYNKGIQDLYNALSFFSEPIPEMREIFGSVYMEKIIQNYSPKEIIDKVNQWKADKDKEEQELHVGDEVAIDNGLIGIIIDVDNDNGIVWVSYRITPAARGLDFCWAYSAKCKKTGRHFDSIPFDYNPEKEEKNK